MIYSTYEITNEVLYSYSLTQDKLSKVTGIPTTTISMWSNNPANRTRNKKAIRKLLFLNYLEKLPHKLVLFLVRFI